MPIGLSRLIVSGYCVIFIFMVGKTHPRELEAKDIEFFLSHLVNDGNVSASTQRQALNALVFLYDKVLDISLEDKIAPSRAKRQPCLPTVLTFVEVGLLLAELKNTLLLMVKLLYSAGLRLRIQDIDFGQGRVYVRAGKGGKDRVTFLPKDI